MPPSALVVSGILSVQLGAGLAGRMFGEVGPAVMTGLRLWTGAALMAALGARAWPGPSVTWPASGPGGTRRSCWRSA